MSVTEQTLTTTTSFSIDSRLLDRARDVAQRRNISVSALIAAALRAELTSDEIADATTANGRSLIGSCWGKPIIQHVRARRGREASADVGARHQGRGVQAVFLGLRDDRTVSVA